MQVKPCLKMSAWIGLLLLLASIGASEGSVFCPRLHLERDNTCVFAFPSCEIVPGLITSCNSASSCACYKECEELWMFPGKQVAMDELTRTCFEGGPLKDLSEAKNRPWRYYNLTRRTQKGTSNTWTVEREKDGKPSPPPDLIRWRFLNETDHNKNQRCLNQCNGAGVCKDGMCECKANRSGIDCSIASGRLATAQNNGTGFIFVYELPPGLNVWRQNYQDTNRDTAMDVIEALLVSPYRTLNASEASLFFLPLAPQTSIQSGYALLAMDYVRSIYPYYNRSNGIDHVTIWSGDPGSCHVALDPLIANTIKVSHFGLKGKSKIMECDCNLCGAGADVVVPDVMEGVSKAQTKLKYKQLDKSERDVFLFYSGSRTSPFRDLMFDTLLNKSRLEGLASMNPHLNISIFDLTGKPRIEHMHKWFQSSKFCLDPPGAGFSTRGTLAIILGCVPVFIGEFNRPYFNSGGSPLNYSKFSITIRKREIERIFDILSAYNYTALKENLDQVWHHFSWASLPNGPRRLSDEPNESDALATMLDVLCRHRRAKLPPSSPLLEIKCSSQVEYLPLRENVMLHG
jgi:hypothetical protein